MIGHSMMLNPMELHRTEQNRSKEEGDPLIPVVLKMGFTVFHNKPNKCNSNLS